jgi:hypothetical protein
MMWPVEEFYDGNNALDKDELRLANIFRERGLEDLAQCVTQGRKVQRFFFGLGTETSFLDKSTFTSLFKGLQQAFSLEEEEDWEQWKDSALGKWEDNEFLQALLNLEKKIRGAKCSDIELVSARS